MPDADLQTPHAAAGCRIVDVAGAGIAVMRRGAGTTVVCLHAVGHSSRDFLRLSERLGHRFAFVSIDWPLQGDSPRDRVPASARRYAELLAAVADQMDLRRFVVLGNSIGGAAAITYAAARPDRVRALVLCNPGGLQPVGLVGRIVCRRMAAFFAKGERADFPRIFRRYYERDVLPSAAAAWRREDIIASARAVAPILREAWESFADPRADIRHLAPQLRCPVLFAWATADRYVAWSRSRRAALSVPDHVVTLFDGGHAPFLEQPERFDEVLAAFIDALPPESATLGAGP